MPVLNSREWSPFGTYLGCHVLYNPRGWLRKYAILYRSPERRERRVQADYARTLAGAHSHIAKLHTKFGDLLELTSEELTEAVGLAPYTSLANPKFLVRYNPVEVERPWEMTIFDFGNPYRILGTYETYEAALDAVRTHSVPVVTVEPRPAEYYETC